MNAPKFEDRTIDHQFSLGAWGYLKHAIAHAYSFSGRAMGLEYGLFCFFAWTLFIAIAAIATELDAAMFQYEAFHFTLISTSISMVILGVAAAAITVRRLHDAGVPAWLFPAAFAGPPILVFALLPSVGFTNDFGPHPKSESGAYRTYSRMSFVGSLRAALNSFSWHS